MFQNWALYTLWNFSLGLREYVKFTGTAPENPDGNLGSISRRKLEGVEFSHHLLGGLGVHWRCGGVGLIPPTPKYIAFSIQNSEGAWSYFFKSAIGVVGGEW